MQLRRVGRQAVLVEVADAAQARSLAAYVVQIGLPVADLVPGARTLLLDGLADSDVVPGLLAGWSPEATTEPGSLVEVPVTYDGPDLQRVAEGLGLTPRDVVRAHTDAEFTAEFTGFAPGFAYLSGWDLRVPRHATPRARVEPGSVALADRWCGVYPAASPGGWQVIGHTDVVLWDPARSAPALLAPGSRVRFVEVP